MEVTLKVTQAVFSILEPRRVFLSLSVKGKQIKMEKRKTISIYYFKVHSALLMDLCS